MKQEGYAIHDQYATYFLTFQVVDWIDIFSRKIYRDIAIESFDYCRKEMDLKIFGYVIMTNHIHAIMKSPVGKLSSNIASFKKFTAVNILKKITEIHESRASWMLKRFEIATYKRNLKSNHQFWTTDNQPKECFSRSFLLQKLNYIHQNPVRAGFVDLPEHYLYSSARNYSNWLAVMEIDLLDI